MSTYSLDIKNAKPRFSPYTTDANGLTPEIDLQGGTLDGALFEGDITSTTFTILVSRVSGGTYVTVKDGLGLYGAVGTAITYTVGSTATGYFPISPILTAGFRFCKIQLGSSEAIALYVSKRNIN